MGIAHTVQPSDHLEADLRDYFRLSAQQVKPAIADLLATGEIERADVDGWSAPAYLRAGRTVPRRTH